MDGQTGKKTDRQNSDKETETDETETETDRPIPLSFTSSPAPHEAARQLASSRRHSAPRTRGTSVPRWPNCWRNAHRDNESVGRT